MGTVVWPASFWASGVVQPIHEVMAMRRDFRVEFGPEYIPW